MGRNTSGVADFIWFSRLAVWLGAVILVIQSVSGRAVGAMTVFAVLCLSLGLLVFLLSLAWSGGWRPLPWAYAVDTQAAGTQPATPPEIPMSEPVAIEPQAVFSASGSPEAGDIGPSPPEPSDAPAPDQHQRIAAGDPDGGEPAEPADAVKPRPASFTAINTFEVVAGGDTEGTLCPRCSEPLAAGQLAVSCPDCEVPQHAACWINNRFHCYMPDCEGAGGLGAPTPREAPE